MDKIIKKVALNTINHAAPELKKVAAYARVSGGEDKMLDSLSAQVSHYSSMIQKRLDWQYAGVYSDEAITGTKDTRAEFKRMLTDCRADKIDMVITKSISRFARNTVTLLQTVRELRTLGIDVYFERENIHSLSADGELMLSILASYAQEESLSVSENCKWRIRKRFEQGEIVNLHFMYGYDIKGGIIKIKPDEAEIVRIIFDDYINGLGCKRIAEKLRNMNAPPPRGGRWKAKSVSKIIKNEKYAGNALLQKNFRLDHISKKLVENRGQLPQYYVQGSHEAIVSEDIFNKAEAIRDSHKAHSNHKNGGDSYPFTGKIRCGTCGKFYQRRINRRPLWNCSTYMREGKAACYTKQIPESVLISVSMEVLGVSYFSEEIFKQRIKEIVVPGFNRLVFIFHDGGTVEKVWKDTPRSASWDEAARQKAREKTLEIIRKKKGE